MDHWCWCSRTLTSLSETFIPRSREGILACLWVVSSRCRTTLPRCGPHCPGYTALHMLEGVGPFLIQPGPVSMWLPCVWLPQETPKGLKIYVRQRHQGHSGAVVSAAAHGVLCEGDPLPDVLVGCLSQCQWGLFLMASTPSPNGFQLNSPHIYTCVCFDF